MDTRYKNDTGKHVYSIIQYTWIGSLILSDMIESQDDSIQLRSESV